MQKEVGRQTGRRRKRNVFLSWINKKSLHHALAKWSPFGSPSPSPCYSWLFGLTALITCRKKCASKEVSQELYLCFPQLLLCSSACSSLCATLPWDGSSPPPPTWHRGLQCQVATMQERTRSQQPMLWFTAHCIGWAVGQTFCQLTSQGQLLATQIHNGFTSEEIWGFGSPSSKRQRRCSNPKSVLFQWTNLSSPKVTESFGKGFT